MSLINEALKKAQKVRTGDSPADLPPMPGGESFTTKRGQPRSAQSILMLTAGGVALVILSVGITFWLINRAPSTTPAPAPVTAPAAAKSSPATPPAAAAAIGAPSEPKPGPSTTAPAVAATSPSTKTEPAAVKPDTSAGVPAAPTTAPAAKPVTVASAPAAPTAPVPTAASAQKSTPPAPALSAPVAPDPAPPPVTSAPVRGDERIHAFVDAIKVTGIRPSGTDSRVLMNDRVFRVNDIVERNLGVRLTKVEADALTFTDANGAVYVKNF